MKVKEDIWQYEWDYIGSIKVGDVFILDGDPSVYVKVDEIGYGKINCFSLNGEPNYIAGTEQIILVDAQVTFQRRIKEQK